MTDSQADSTKVSSAQEPALAEVKREVGGEGASESQANAERSQRPKSGAKGEQQGSETIGTASGSGVEAIGGAIAGLVFWILVIGAGLYSYFHEEEADVWLDVADTRCTVQVQGYVRYKGKPIQGLLQMRVSDSPKKQLLQSVTMEVRDGAVPSTSISSPQGSVPADGCTKERRLRVDADFLGDVSLEEGKSITVRGETRVFLNEAPPLSRNVVYWSLGGVALFGAVLTSLITGSMGPAKAHMLFAFMYFATFLSLAMPIAGSIWVAQNPFLQERMKQSPVGLVFARHENATKAQWLVNIGGRVEETGSAAELLNRSAKNEEPPAASGKNGALQANIATPTPSGAKSFAPPTDDASRPQKKEESPAAPSSANNDPHVVGGLAVPFYVVMLALFGAGVNLTRRVPKVQREYYEFLGGSRPGLIAATGEALASLFRGTSKAERKGAAEVREKLVQNIMYFAAAPFLAIAVYYLLRLLATEVTQPALVITAFATGLVSDRVVVAVIEAAGKLLGGKGDEDEAARKKEEAAHKKDDAERQRKKDEAAH